MTDYFVTDVVEKTHDSVMNNKIKKTLNELKSLNVELCTDNTIHIFLDTNYLSKSINIFIAEITKYMNSHIKIYFIKEDKINPYLSILVTEDNIEKIKCAVDVQRELHRSLFKYDNFLKYITDQSIIKYVNYALIL